MTEKALGQKIADVIELLDRQEKEYHKIRSEGSTNQGKKAYHSGQIEEIREVRGFLVRALAEELNSHARARRLTR